MSDARGPARRLAFVVPEWTTTEEDPGDQALVTERICVALLDAGWSPEVFAPSDEPGTVDEDGITVHRVARGHAPPGMPAAEWFERVVDKSILAAGLRKAMNNDGLLASTRMRERRELLAAEAQARLLGAAVEARQQDTPFQAAISTDIGFVGLHVPPRRSRPHIVRVTGWPHEWAALDEDVSPARRRRVAAEVKAIEDAQGLYASCSVVADKVGDSLGRRVPVVRPPAPLAPHTGQRVEGVPRRYLLMCGPLDRRHGVETLAAALPHAWRIAPELQVVLAGVVDPERWADWEATWGELAERVTHVDDPGGGDQVALAARAVALVVPALADDLSEMAQQGLAVGVPVIATRGAGTSELVTPGVTGTVVPSGSPAKLGEALAAAWSGRWGVAERVRWSGPVRDEMEPDVAARALLELVAEVRDEWAEPAPQG
ncbi:MAG: glycosyltransferase [Acidimicrobiales bacterium]|jgi:glycosyltransferase involved in cell wall biosynthesis|nr:glycosyltransferase [Acidimicrobiales bacterium]MCU0272965.1 glycosyltransferase [Acidimicrobiales bacterium]